MSGAAVLFRRAVEGCGPFGYAQGKSLASIAPFDYDPQTILPTVTREACAFFTAGIMIRGDTRRE